MKIVVSATIAAAMVLGGHAVVGGQEANAPRVARVRTIHHFMDAPLPSRIRPDDEILLVTREDGLVIVYDANVSPRKAIETASEHARGAAVVKIENIEAKLIEDDTWIGTFSTAAVVTTIRETSDFPLKQGTQFTMMEHVGELAIAGKIVRAGPPVLEPLQPGRVYLVVLTYDPEKRLAYPTGRWLVREDGSLQDTTSKQAPDWRQKLTGLQLEAVINSLRRMKGPGLH